MVSVGMKRSTEKVPGVLVKLVTTEVEREGACQVRFRVFVDEQSVPPQEELDEHDAAATHAVALYQGKVVATGRLVVADPNTARIGRMAVELPWRRQGIGGQVLQLLEKTARSRGVRQCILHSQEYVKAFYSHHGYQERGDVFLEANIPHIEMRKDL